MAKTQKPAESATEFVAKAKKEAIRLYLDCTRYVARQGLVAEEIEGALRHAAQMKFIDILQGGVERWKRAEIEKAIGECSAWGNDLLSEASIAEYNKTA